jgi:translin
MFPEEAVRKAREELEEREEMREEVIKTSRDALRDAKRAIIRAHDNDLKEADELLRLAQQTLTSLKEKYPGATSVGAHGEACEEFVEAACFVAVKTKKTVPSAADLGVDAETYLAGLSDCAGELSRTAVLAAIARDEEAVRAARDFVVRLQEELVQARLRGNLRKKYDAVKYHLQRIEQALYDLTAR